MKRIKLSFALALVFTVVLFAGDEKKYGEKIELTEKTSIENILSNPEAFVGKKVLVEGMVVDVCPKRGCWIDVADEEAGKIKVKVNDGEIIFPMESKGKTALVEGEVYKIEMTKEEAIERAKHHAEEKNEEFDPSTITGPQTWYQIKGLGAVIK